MCIFMYMLFSSQFENLANTISQLLQNDINLTLNISCVVKIFIILASKDLILLPKWISMKNYLIYLKKKIKKKITAWSLCYTGIS